mgnify:FL=1
MKVFDVLSTMNSDALTSIEFENFSEPIVFDEVRKVKLNPKIDGLEVEKIYPEYYKGMKQTGITVIVKAVAG